MNNIATAIKRFLANKNTVTLLGVIAAVVVIYIGYTWRVNKSIEKVSVPCSNVEIGSRELVEAEMLDTCEIPRTLVTKFSNLITNNNDIVGKYVAYGTTIPENGFFYTTSVYTSDEMPDSAFADIAEGTTIFSLSVSLSTTYGNSIYPGNKIDLYFKANDDDGKVIFGKFVESIEVLAVKDSSGRHVFETTVESRTPAELLFAVPDDMYTLLMKALYISANVEIIPVPRNATYTAQDGAAQVSSEYIKDFILSKTTYFES